jgi:L-arabinose transport system substrate-binding protein
MWRISFDSVQFWLVVGQLNGELTHMYTARRRPLAALVGLLVALGLTACSSAPQGDGIGRVTGGISLTYLQKQGDQAYFVAEATGARQKAAQLGVDLSVVDVGSNAGKAVSEVRSAIGQHRQGVIIVAPDPSIGPEVTKAAEDARMALLSSDDQLCSAAADPGACAHQDLVPRVGFSSSQIGDQLGQRAAKEYRQAGWAPADTRIIAAWEQDVTVCGQRVNTAGEAFFNVAGQLRTLDVSTDNTQAGAKQQVALTIAANPGVKHWIVLGCNDENVQGGLDALQAAGVGAGDVIGIGMGGYLACQDWRAGGPTGMRAALYINGADVGALAVQTMVDKLRGGKPFPPEVLAPATMVDPGSRQAAGLTCG